MMRGTGHQNVPFPGVLKSNEVAINLFEHAAGKDW